MTKVRHIEWRPDEYLAGTFGKLTLAEHGLYIVVLSLIYSHGGPVQNDLQHLARACAGTHWRTVKAAFDGLVAKGKLRVSTDGQWLTNGRAVSEIDRAVRRVERLRLNGAQGGRPRGATGGAQDQFKTGSRRSHERRDLRKIKGLTKPGGYELLNTYDSSLSESHTDAAREPSPEHGAAQARAHIGPDSQDPERPEGPFRTALPPTPFEGEKRAPPPQPKTTDRLTKLAAEARAKLLKGSP